MKHREITDEMCIRALASYGEGYRNLPGNMEVMRKALDAALNPPPREPLIYASIPMIRAGSDAILGIYQIRKSSDWYEEAALGAYRAMRVLEPKAVPKMLFCGACGSTYIHEEKRAPGPSNGSERRRKEDCRLDSHFHKRKYDDEPHIHRRITRDGSPEEEHQHFRPLDKGIASWKIRLHRRKGDAR